MNCCVIAGGFKRTFLKRDEHVGGRPVNSRAVLGQGFRVSRQTNIVPEGPRSQNRREERPVRTCEGRGPRDTAVCGVALMTVEIDRSSVGRLVDDRFVSAGGQRGASSRVPNGVLNRFRPSCCIPLPTTYNLRGGGVARTQGRSRGSTLVSNGLLVTDCLVRL